jgi:sucrose-6-phosphate hydrolase SacC (GH32 family)
MKVLILAFQLHIDWYVDSSGVEVFVTDGRDECTLRVQAFMLTHE